MTPYKIFDLEIGESALFGPEYGGLERMTRLAGNIGRARRRRFEVTAAPGGSLVTRLTDKAEKPKRITLAQRLRDIAPGTKQFFAASQFNPVSLRATASGINKTGERRLQVSVETSPIHGTRVTSLDITNGITDATGTPINFAAGQRMRKYPFTTMAPGDSFTVPAGSTNITALRSSVQHYRTRNPTRQYQITRHDGGSFTVTCSERPGAQPVPAMVPLETNVISDFEAW
jgi:hypothetical protein